MRVWFTGSFLLRFCEAKAKQKQEAEDSRESAKYKIKVNYSRIMSP